MNTNAILYFDGCSKGNPGPSGSGAMIKYNDLNDISLCEYVGNTTNNVAEYKGLILGLKYLNKHLNKLKHLIIKGDSMLVINHMTGKYKVKSPNLLPLYNEAKELIQQIKNVNIEIDIVFLYIPREENKEADYLANMGLKTFKTTFGE
jgi:ribonuclease HI